METGKQRFHLTGIALIILAVLYGFSDVLGSDRILSFRDHMDVFRPTFEFVVNQIREGQFPLGPMHSQAGTPLEAQLNGTYTPLTLILFSLPDSIAYDWFVVGHYILLGLGTYGFARHFSLDHPAAVGVSIFCSLAGPVLSTENLLSAAHGLAFTPWVYWALDRLLLRRTTERVILFAMALSFQVQGAIPIVLLMNVLVGFALVYHRRETALRSSVIGVLTGCGLAFALAAIEIGGVLEYLPLSRRGQGFSYEEASRWSVTAAQLAEFFIPSLWWAPEKTYLIQTQMIGSEMPPYFISLYLGTAVPLALGACTFRHKFRLVCIAALILVVVVSMGAATPLHQLFYKLPLLKSSRFPVKYTLLLVPLTGFLLSAGLNKSVRYRQGQLLWSFIYLIGAVIMISVTGTDEFRNLLQESFSPESIEALPIGITVQSYGDLFAECINSRVMHVFLFALLLTLVLLYAVTLKSDEPHWISWALCLIIALDLASAANTVIRGAPNFPASPSKKVMAEISGKEHLVFIATPRGRRAAFAQSQTRTDFDSSILSANQRGHNSHKELRYLRDIDRNGLSPLASRLAMETLKQSNFEEAMNLMRRSGTKWMGTYSRGLFPNALTQMIPNERPQYFYKIDEVRQYAKFHPQWKYVDFEDMSPAQQVRTIKSMPADIAFVSTKVPDISSTCTGTVSSATISVARDSIKHTVTVTSESECYGIISILETNMPNWKAYVNDKPTQVVTVDF
ncbi:MAG: hypothetical protein VYC39_14955 [Myxococcota bacterium]|nr:hypothetical protein [Myxococcota bacterium]